LADEIRADYTQLQQVATQFSRQATAINRMQQQMKRSLSALQGNWIGHGSEAFFSEMRDKVLPATQRLADALRAAQKVTLQISQVLRAAEEDAARPFRRCAGLAAPGYASQHTVRSALDLIRELSTDIKVTAEKHNLDPLLLAGVVFAENRNDRNWIRGQDWSSIFGLGLVGGAEVKNLVSPLMKSNPAIGVTEVSLAVAAMMDDSGLVPANYGDLSWEERIRVHEEIAKGLSGDERKRILGNLSDSKRSLEYAAKYLNFLADYRDYGDDYALWLSDYNRGLSNWDTTTEYGRRIDVYRKNIEYVLNWRESPATLCIGQIGCAQFYDSAFHGVLP